MVALLRIGECIAQHMNAARNWRCGGARGFSWFASSVSTPQLRCFSVSISFRLLLSLYSLPANKTCSISGDSYRSTMIAMTPPLAAAFAPLATRAAVSPLPRRITLCLHRRKARQKRRRDETPPPEPPLPPEPAWAHAPPLSSPCLCGAFESLILPHLRCLTAVPEKAVLSQMLLICGATAGPATGTETALGIRAETAANKSVAN